MKTTIILNPKAGGGRAGRRLYRLTPLLDEAFQEPDIVETTGPGDGKHLAREALRKGSRRIVAVGGDGTINDVLNGFFENGEPVNPEAVLAPLACGTGSDLVRSIRKKQWFPSTLRMRIRRVARGDVRPIDVGRLRCTGLDGGEHVRYYGNVASLGYTTDVIDYVNEARLPAWMGGTTTFFWSILQTLWSSSNHAVEINVDGESLELSDALCVMFANGRYFAGGIAIAPEASITDGWIDVVAIYDAAPTHLFRSAHAFYLGRQDRLEEVTMLRGRHIEVTSTESVRIETDGEIAGTLPATIDVLPGAVLVQG